MEDFYEQHMENCDYCEKLSNSNLPDKDKLIDTHTMNAYADLCDRAYSEWKERDL